MFFGFPCATITQRLLLVNLTALFSVNPVLLSWLVHLVSADMKTSHGEPEVICVYRALDEPGLTIMLQLFAVLNAWVILATTLVKLDAMKTRKSTGCGVGVGLGDGKGVGADDCVGAGEAVGIGVADGVGVMVDVGEADIVEVGVGVGEGMPFKENAPMHSK